ncbi:MAG TPA: ABC transporter permease [Gemmatimonadaceae bacterium]|nr:ABC transporter permease [Gemmatimonadaceae bacterium]
MKALDLKLIRDLLRLKSQVVSIAAIVACGSATVIAMRSTLDSIQRARDDYYDRARFPQIFASLKRAPESIARRIERVQGVGSVETRIVASAVLDVPGLSESATGYFVSVPPEGEPTLSALYIRNGRQLSPRAEGEVLVNELFAEANKIRPGDSLAAVINGRWERLRVVGIALSPEFIFNAVPGIGMFADNKHVAILWMRRNALGPLYQMDGAFNDVVATLAPGANESAVIASIDDILRRFGGGHAYGRKDQLSNNVLSGEIEQLRVFGTAMPFVFLSVAAFLLNVVLSRLVATQREEIAVLKAFGYTNRRIGVHFLGYALAAVALGAVGGIALGIWVGRKYTALYVAFFRFPSFEHYSSAVLIASAVLVSAIAAITGALFSVRAAIRLAPAEAMRPPAPTAYRPLLLERLGFGAFLSTGTRMLFRNLERRPIRTVASVIGVAFSAAILVVGTFAFDSARYMSDIQFRTAQREDIAVGFTNPRHLRVRRELAEVHGITRIELYRSTPVRIWNGQRSRQLGLTGVEPEAMLRRLVDRSGRHYRLPAGGLVMTSALAKVLEIAPGDTVILELLERGGERRFVPVVALLDEMIGFNAYMARTDVNALLREGPSASGAYISVVPEELNAVVKHLGLFPAVAGSVTREAMLKSFDEQIAESMRLTVIIVVSLASVVALGVIYNGIRISFSERARELASLRVLGFSRREVATLLFGEQGIIDVLGAPLGLLLGLGLAYWIATGFATESYRFPVVVTARTYVFSLAVVFTMAVAASVAMRGRVYKLDLVAVLKTRE